MAIRFPSRVTRNALCQVTPCPRIKLSAGSGVSEVSRAKVSQRSISCSARMFVACSSFSRWMSKCAIECALSVWGNCDTARHLIVMTRRWPGTANAVRDGPCGLACLLREGDVAARYTAHVRPCGQRRPDAVSAVEHRPADVVAQPLVVEDKLANRLRELVALPLALASPCALGLSLWRSGACGFDRIGGGAKLMSGDVRNDRSLPGGICGIARRPLQVSGCAHRMAARRARLGHHDLATRPGVGRLDSLAWSRILGSGRFEDVKDVLRARRRPQGEKPMIRIGEGSTATDRYETWIADFR